MTPQNARNKLIETIRRKGLALKTERSYLGWLERYMFFLGYFRPCGSSARKMEAFLTHLARDRKVAPSTQNQAFNAILFFYREVLQEDLGSIQALRAKHRHHIRHAPSEKQTAALLSAVKDRNGYPVRLICHILYGCGLRVSEPLDLRTKDVDLENRRLIVREAKGGKDRAVSIPDCLIPPIQTQLHHARATWEADQRAELPVQLPGGLRRKYPAAQFSWGWAWIFPAHNPCQHPRDGHQVRYRMHEANVQRAVRQAAQALDLEGVITPHILRHAYATHVMRQGAYVRDVQTTMGHNSLETTMGYLHAESGRVPSPLKVIHSAA